MLNKSNKGASPLSLLRAARQLLGIGILLCAASASFAANAPSQIPLFSVVSGAKPNLMFMLDNSGSMAFEFPENYYLDNACKDGTDAAGKGTNCSTRASYDVCKDGYTTNSKYTAPTELVGRSIPQQYRDGWQTRIGCQNSSGSWVRENTSVETITITTPTKHGWYKMRSSAFNPQYYNPAITYSPRVKADGTAVPNSLKFVDNQESDGFFYRASIGGYCWPNDCRSRDYDAYTPKYNTYGLTASVPTGAKFSYAICTDTSCASATEVTLTYTSATNVTLPLGHARSDCGKNATTCSAALERQNILNWYEWYRTRISSITTAVGQAMQSYNNKFRIGYGKYSDANSSRNWDSTQVDRGVRYFRDESSSTQKWKSDFYSWLYSVQAYGNTPSHNTLQLAGKYYNKDNRTTLGNPWRNDPTSTAVENANSDLSCRRAYTIVLSDGAWSPNTSAGANSKYASIDGTSNFSGSPGGNSTALRYNPAGATGSNSTGTTTNLAARSLYIPYTDNRISSKGFADLAANYFWNTDFSSVLPNNVPPIPGQNNPTFWQNMTTYTIGWGLTPSGDAGKSGGLTWSQIDTYINDWLAGRLATRPKWADDRSSVDLDETSSEELRINDFIRAGFTGGGRSYSVYSSDDVRRAIDGALSSMVGSGNDAGVAVSGNSGDFQTLENLLKYTTEYNTSNNTGDIKSFLLDANGNYSNYDASGTPIPVWSANERMPAVNNRKLFSLSGYDPANPSINQTLRKELNYSTRLSDLPADFTSLLNANAQQKTDETFVRYILGAEGLANASGAIYRMRDKPIAASVNSPPVFVGGRINMGYAEYGSVDGGSFYDAFMTRKKTLPATIFAATNAGKVHVINAAQADETLKVGGVNVRGGAEVAAFMPKNAMRAQIDLADPAFRFRYVLDGPVVEHDAYDDGARTPSATTGGTWRSLVFGTGGRAGNFLYGLESPLNASDRVPTKNHFLWEVDSSAPSYKDLANVTNNPTAGQLDNGRWVMLTPSGHYGGASKQVGLYVVDAFSGQLVKFIPLPDSYNNDGTTMRNRGLGGVVAVRGMDRKIAAAYAGDANGNLWRFDLRSSKLAVSYDKPIFTTPGGAKQPIYGAPAWQAHPGDGTGCKYSSTSQCGAIVVVATGILLDEDDLTTPATRQGIYGVWDPTAIGSDDKPGFTTVTVSQLVEQTIDLASAKDGTGKDSTGRTFYQVSSNAVDWKTRKGWFLNLGVISITGAMTDGERSIGDLSNLGSSVQITTFLPEGKDMSIESCTATGSLPNIMYILDTLTGKNKRSFDINSDGRADLYSIAAIPDGGFTRGNVTSRNALGLPNEGDVQLKPKIDCTDETAYFTGVGGTIKGFDACVSTGWRRSWRPVVNPPF